MRLLILFVITYSAHAFAFPQVRCSNSDGTVKWNEGKGGNQILLKHRTPNGRTETLTDYQVDVQNEQVLENRGEKNGGRTCGIENGTLPIRTYYRKVRITKADSSLLPEDVAGLSKDRRSLEVALICQESDTCIE